ncbi:unnamed protein product [Arabidopsis halleri]
MKVSETLSQGRVMVDERFGSVEIGNTDADVKLFLPKHTGFRFCRLFQHVKVTS